MKKELAQKKTILSSAPIASSLRRSPLAEHELETVPPVVHETLRDPGLPLDAETRSLFEPQFGHDFSNVRVHTNAKAADSARAQDARAYTVGWDVVFGSGQYAPKSRSGKQLLAHELTHVMQQQGTRPILRRQQAGGSSVVGKSDEAAAERASFETEKQEFEVEKAQQRIIACSGLITRWIKLHRDETEPEQRQEIQGVLRTLEGQLAEALEQNIHLLEAAQSKDVPAVRKELAENRVDLDVLKRIMSVERTRQFVAQYTKDALGNLNCMGAAYQGMGAIYGQDEVKLIKEGVEAKAKEYKKKTKTRKRPQGIDIDHIITVMDTVREKGKAGEKMSAFYDRQKGKWNPTLKELVLGNVNRAFPGCYFFGLSLADAFHSVILLVETWTTERPKIYWCDQILRCQEALDLDQLAKERLTDWEQQGILTYKHRETAIWPLLPPPEAGIFGAL